MAAVPARTQLVLRQLSLSRLQVLVAAGIVGGIAARVWTYRSTLGVPNSDDALVGLVGLHALHGDFSTFYWGMNYGGTQEPLLTVPVFFVFGTSWLAVRSVPIVLSAVAALLVWRVGRRTIGEPAATAAGVIFWIWPPFNIVELMRPGFYASNVFYCALLMLLALRAVERPSRVRVGLFGLVVGLGYWETSQIVPIVLPLIAWMIWKEPRCVRQIWVAVPLALLGALPWLVWNIRHDFASLDLLSFAVHTTYWHRLRIFVSPLLPMITNLRQPFTQALTLPALLTHALYLVLAVLFVYGAVRSRRSNASILYVVAIAFPFLWAISPSTLESGDPRYLVVFTPVLTLLLAQLATRYYRAVGLIAALGALTIVGLHRGAQPFPGPQPPSPPRDFRPLISTLDRLGVHYVYSSHWVVYRLAFETHERIIGVKNDWAGVRWVGGQADPIPNSWIRYPPYERRVRAGRHAFIFYRATYRSFPEVRVAKPLERYGYERHFVGPLVVFTLPRSA